MTRSPPCSGVGYVFDLDGVICVGPNFSAALEREYGIAPARWGHFFQGEFLNCIVGRRDLKDALRPLLPQLGWTDTVEALLEFWFTREAAVCPRALACARTLRAAGSPCFLGTNQEGHRADYVWKTMGLSEHFDALFASCHLGHAKPAPEFFAAVERLTGLERLTLIDDSARNCRSAEERGWTVFHYQGISDLNRILKTVAVDAR